MPLSAGAIIGLIGAAASATGAGLSIAGNISAKNALERARAAEVARQGDLDAKAQALSGGRIKQATKQTADQQMATGEADRLGKYQQLNDAENPVASALPATGSTAVNKAKARATTTGNAWNILNSTAQARLGSYGDWQNRQNLGNEDAADKIGVLTNFSGADARLQPAELDVAAHSGDALSGWGGIVSQLGQVAGAANSAGVFKGSGTAMTPLSQAGNYPGTASMLDGAAAASRAQRFAQASSGTSVWTNLFK